MGRTDIDQADIASLQFIDLKETVLDRDGNDGIAAVAENLPAQAEAGSSTPMQAYLS